MNDKDDDKTPSKPNRENFLDFIRRSAEGGEYFREELKQGIGLYPGLYLLAGADGIGKTSFAVYMADLLAAEGNHVIFFTLTHSRFELACKGVARETEQEPGRPVTALRIMAGDWTERIAAGLKTLKEKTGDRVTVVDTFNCTLGLIRNYVSRFMAQTQTAPIVFVDDLDALRLSESRWSKQENIWWSDIMDGLSSICRDNKIPIVALGKIDYDVAEHGYGFPLNINSFGKFGDILPDAIWGLQLQFVHDEERLKAHRVRRDFSGQTMREVFEAELAERPRKIELVCLRERYNGRKYTVFFDYQPPIERFELTGTMPSIPYKWNP